jgi:serine/threonine-protein phosphatase PGAM5
VPLHTLYLVRHGQYDEKDDGSLTKTGRVQAGLTAKALGHVRFSTIYTSTLRRALETTEVFAKTFPKVPIKPMHLLREAIPTDIPRMPDYAPRLRIRADRARAEAAFERLFRPVRRSRSDLVIAHGNLIRFFACRALEVEPVTWVKLGSTHCSITEVVIESNGYMRLRTFNETHHLPKKLRTLSLAASKQD